MGQRLSLIRKDKTKTTKRTKRTKTTKRTKINRKSRRLRGGNTQYLSNVGYSSGYSLPFYKPYVTNIV